MARRPPGKASPGSRSLVGRESCFHTALFFTAAGELMASSGCETGGEKSLSLPGNEAGSRELPSPHNLHKPGSASQVIWILPHTLWMALSASWAGQVPH